MKRDCPGIWIPKEIWFNSHLSSMEKMLFAEITSLNDPDKGGCYASNEYLSNFLGIKVRQTQQCISNLKKYGLIKQSAFNGRERILKSTLEYVIRDAENCTSEMQIKTGLFHIREEKEEDVRFSPKEPFEEKSVVAIESEKYHYLSELLITKIKSSGTEMKIIPKKLIPKWAIDFRAMIKYDGKTEKEIEVKIEEIFADEFWCKVIRSAGSIREKWKLGKLDGLKASQNAQEPQGPTKTLTPWEELCRDSGDPGQRVWDKMVKLWETLEGKSWQEYKFLPQNPSRDPRMQTIFEIMYAHNGDHKETLQKIKNYLERSNG